MSFHKFFDFLRDLNQNNSKEWMDENRKRYAQVRDWYIGWCDEMDDRLAAVDEHYHRTTGRDAIHRINNNKLYKPDLPTYKDNFSCSFDLGKMVPAFYLHLGLNDSFIGGGFYKASSGTLKKIRSAVDADGETLEGIINEKAFVDRFGELSNEDALKTAPKGYSKDHPHIALLNRKSFAALTSITQKEITDEGFPDLVVATYKDMLPLRNW